MFISVQIKHCKSSVTMLEKYKHKKEFIELFIQHCNMFCGPLTGVASTPGPRPADTGLTKN